MNIYMLGIDHSRASVEYREKFSFTKKEANNFMKEIKKSSGICGCIILSTCNRSEIWISSIDDFSDDIYKLLGSMKNISINNYEELFTERKGIEAVRHLFQLTSGMKSKVIGEDQVLTQVKEALSLSRENYCTDNVLEVLFRMSITSAKKAKTTIHLSTANSSVIHRMINTLYETGYQFINKKCMVIGNGEMGKLAASMIKSEGADVTVTVREYKSGLINIPAGCNRIGYGDRIDNIDDYDMVISATASPNVTIKVEHIESLKLSKPKLFIDLAVPRDIEPEIANVPNITLYNIDSFHLDRYSDKTKQQINEINMLLEEDIREFISWYECRDIVPNIQTICENAATDIYLRLEKKLKQLNVAEEEKKHLDESIKTAANKVVNKLLFGLKDNVDKDVFRECVEAFEKLY